MAALSSFKSDTPEEEIWGNDAKGNQFILSNDLI